MTIAKRNENLRNLINEGHYLGYTMLFMSIAELEQLNQETIDHIMKLYNNYRKYMDYALNY